MTRGAADRGQLRQAAGAIAETLKRAVSSNQRSELQSLPGPFRWRSRGFALVHDVDFYQSVHLPVASLCVVGDRAKLRFPYGGKTSRQRLGSPTLASAPGARRKKYFRAGPGIAGRYSQFSLSRCGTAKTTCKSLSVVSRKLVRSWSEASSFFTRPRASVRPKN
jgi:hypothetical protein